MIKGKTYIMRLSSCLSMCEKEDREKMFKLFEETNFSEEFDEKVELMVLKMSEGRSKKDQMIRAKFLLSAMREVIRKELLKDKDPLYLDFAEAIVEMDSSFLIYGESYPKKNWKDGYHHIDYLSFKQNNKAVLIILSKASVGVYGPFHYNKKNLNFPSGIKGEKAIKRFKYSRKNVAEVIEFVKSLTI